MNRSQPRPPHPRPPARMNQATLAAAAVFYLSRYASSSGNLRQVLARKIKRSAAYYEDDPAPLLAAIESIIADHARNGALDDALYAQTQAAKLRRRGGSTRGIVQRLANKGVPAEIVAETMHSGESASDDRAAALKFAKRRRLGPYRGAQRAENRQRDLAALGRAGFDYQTAAKVIDAVDPDEVDEA